MGSIAIRWGFRALAVIAACAGVVVFLDYRDLNLVRQHVVAEEASQVLLAGDATAAGLAALSATNADFLKRALAGRDHPALSSLAARAALESREERIFAIADAERVLNASVSSSLGLIAAQYERRVDVFDINSGAKTLSYQPANADIDHAEFVFGGDYLAVQEQDEESGQWRLALLAPAEGALAVAAEIDLGSSDVPLGVRALQRSGWLEIKYRNHLTAWRPFPDGARFDLTGDNPNRVPDRMAINGNSLAAIMRAAPALGETAHHGIAIYSLIAESGIRPELRASFDYPKANVTPQTDDLPVDLVFAEDEGALIVAYRDGLVRVFADTAAAPASAGDLSTPFGALVASQPASGGWRWVSSFEAISLPDDNRDLAVTIFRDGLRTIHGGRTLLVSGSVANREVSAFRLQSFRPRTGSWSTGNVAIRFAWRSSRVYRLERAGVERLGEASSGAGEGSLDYVLSNDGRYAVTNDDQSIALWSIGEDGSFDQFHDALSDEQAVRFDGAIRRRGAVEGFLVESGGDRPPRMISVRRNIGLGESLSTLVRVFRLDKQQSGWSRYVKFRAQSALVDAGNGLQFPLLVRTKEIDSLSADGGLIAVSTSEIDDTIDARGALQPSDDVAEVNVFDASTGRPVSTLKVSDNRKEAILRLRGLPTEFSVRGALARIAGVPQSIALHAGGGRLAMLDVDGTVHVWGGVDREPAKIGAIDSDVKDSSLFRAVPRHFDRSVDYEILWSLSGERLFIVGDRNVWAYTIFESGAFAPKLAAKMENIQAYAIGGETLIAVHQDEAGSMSMIAPTSDGMSVTTLAVDAPEGFAAETVAMTRDGKRSVAAGKNGAIVFFGEDAPAPFDGAAHFGDFRVVALALSEDGARTFAKTEDGRVFGIDNKRGEVLWARTLAERGVGRLGLRGSSHDLLHDMLAVSGDGKLLCTTELGRAASILDAKAGALIQNFNEKIGDGARCGFAGAAAFVFDRERYQVVSDIPISPRAAVQSLRTAMPAGARILTAHVPSTGTIDQRRGRRLARAIDRMSEKMGFDREEDGESAETQDGD